MEELRCSLCNSRSERPTEKQTFNSSNHFCASHARLLTFFHENTAQNILSACEQHKGPLAWNGGKKNLYFKDETSLIGIIGIAIYGSLGEQLDVASRERQII